MRQLIADICKLNTVNTQAYEPHMFSFSWEKLGKDYRNIGSKDKYKRILS